MNAPYEATSWASAIPQAPWPPTGVAGEQAVRRDAPARARRGVVAAAVVTVVVLLAALAAGPAAARPSVGVQDEYSNNGWYTGLEHADLPARPVATDESGIDRLTFAIAAALGAALVAGTVVATRRRPEHLAA